MDDRTIHMESKVGSKDMTPMVVLRWGNEAGELTPDEARQHALSVLMCAEAAEHDAAMVHWLTQIMEMPLEAAVLALGDLRVFRGMT